MAYSDPRTWATGDIVTASALNQDLRDNVAYLKGITEGVTFSGTKVTRDGAAAQSIPDATDTDVTFTAESFDAGAWWSSGATVTVPSGAIPSGYTTIAVLLIGIVRFVSNSTGGRKIIFLKNGSEVDSLSVAAQSGEATTVSLTAFATCSAADTFKMQVRQSSTAALNMDVARFTIVRFAPAS